jgi:glyoxylase-like metal-dependent hydrolase (beta-lactamase superfamily II)
VEPRWLRADNPGPFTLDGTRTYLVGRIEVAVVDPGPDLESHVRALAAALAEAREVTLLLTHGHDDHAGAVDALLRALHVEARVVGTGHERAVPAGAGGVATDHGRLVPVATPGHTPDHLAWHWVERRALFAGDHLLGEGDTTWVAEYPGCVADYLESLTRLRALDLAVVFPAHGPPLTDPAGALERYRVHRLARVEAVRRVLSEHPGAAEALLYREVYGDSVPPELEAAARRSLAALREYVDTRGRRGVSSSP